MNKKVGSMSSKAQSQILGTVLISSILLGLAGTAFIWGKPLVDKSTDKSKIDVLILKMEELDGAIRTVSASGGSKTVTIKIGKDEEFRVTDGELILQTYITVPIISSKDYAPLNSFDLSTRIDLVNIDHLVPNYNPSYRISGITENVFEGSVLLDSINYTALTYNLTTCDDYCYLCLVDDLDTPRAEECGKRNEIINLTREYSVETVSIDGSISYISGGEIENLGVLGKDPAGIISGRSKILGSSEGLLTNVKLSYRGLVDNSGFTHRIVIDCENNCFVSEKVAKINIRRSDILRKNKDINTYLLINVE